MWLTQLTPGRVRESVLDGGTRWVFGLHVYSAAADGSLGSRDLSAAELEGHETPHQLAPSLPSWLVTKHQFEL